MDTVPQPVVALKDETNYLYTLQEANIRSR